jgi:carboxymethylenebutenolidase
VVRAAEVAADCRLARVVSDRCATLPSKVASVTGCLTAAVSVAPGFPREQVAPPPERRAAQSVPLDRIDWVDTCEVVTGTNLKIETQHGLMPAYGATPTTAAPWPGVVVVHDFTGMSQDLRSQADWLAAEGYLTVAPDLYYWGSRLSCLRTIMRDIGERRGRTFDDIDGARRWLTNHHGCTGRIGVIGFCMGGGYALALAPGRGFSASSVNYGGCPKDAATWLPGACPIVGSFGAADRSPLGRRAGQRLDRTLAALAVPHDVKIYPGVGHGFMNDHDRADATLFLRFLSRISGTKYDDAATRDARRRIITFFSLHLRSASE